MVKAYIAKRISPDINGFDALQWRLERDPDLASALGFDPDDIPHYTTLATQWWERYRHDFRTHVRYEAAKAALKCQTYELEVADDVGELIDEFDDSSTKRTGDIPEKHRLEIKERDRVFNEYRNLFNRLLDYGRGANKQIETAELTELATFTSRRNESVLGGRDVYTSEHRVTDQGYMCSEALAKPIRELSRQLAEQNYARNAPLVPGDGEENYDWSVNPTERDFGEGERWHDRTERGIGEQVEMLQDRGMLDRPVDICIDGTARDYHNRNDTDVEEPAGVHHRYPKFDTGYAWEDITLTAIYRGRAIVLANISKVKADDQFQCVRYLIDRARDLVNVRNVYADSEFGTARICSYLVDNRLDYVIKKSKKGKTVKSFLDEADGRADWKPYTIEGADGSTHHTTLLALESTSKSVTKKGEGSKSPADDDAQQTFEDFGASSPGDDEEISRESFITSLDVNARGLHHTAAGPRREDHTAFSVQQLYRRRWSIETAFRDIKRNFKAMPRSRCLGVRRFFFMLCLLLYNCWVLLNLIVADEMDHREDDEILWRKKIFIIDLNNEVFPDVEFG